MANGDWIQTFTGEVIYPLSDSPGNIRIDDIAHSLGMQCRYTGHCAGFYSVAEHSVHVSDILKSGTTGRRGQVLALYGILHDATEAYLSDIPRPIKPLLPEYLKAEGRLMKVIFKRFGLDDEMPKQVHLVDKSILAVEKEALMTESKEWELDDIVGVHAEIQCWNPRQAEVEFLKRFFSLCPERYW